MVICTNALWIYNILSKMKRWTPEAVFLLTLCLSVFQRKFFFFITFISFSLILLIYLPDVV